MKQSTKVIALACVTSAAIGGTILPAVDSVAATGQSGSFSAHHNREDYGVSRYHVWNDAQAVIEVNRRITRGLEWDGRYQYTQRDHQHGLCLEFFNGTSHDEHGLNPGGFLKVCQDGHYFYNDGVAFNFTETF